MLPEKSPWPSETRPEGEGGDGGKVMGPRNQTPHLSGVHLHYLAAGTLAARACCNASGSQHVFYMLKFEI